MTNESIFYILGLFLGFLVGYATRSFRANKQTIKLVIDPTKEERRSRQ